MKRKPAVALLLAATLLSGGAVMAADAGSAGDPLISLEWLKNTFLPNTTADAQARADDALEAVYDAALDQAAAGEELRLKRGDVLRLESGSGALSLAGSVSATATGALVDVTAGIELSNGALTSRHRYLAAEKTTAMLAVTTDTAALRLTGRYTLSPSGEVDYYALADALHAMGLFRGTGATFGSGYDLELAPTRIQGLILFLRLIGQEENAFQYIGSATAFADVPDWALPYAVYAYDKGYTKGMATDGAGRVVFGTDLPLSARDYTTFLLRALGYAEGSDFSWGEALQDAVSLGMLTAGEKTLLSEKPFLRSQTVYLSYYALSAPTKGTGGTLLDQLISAGAVDASQADQAVRSITGKRL